MKTTVNTADGADALLINQLYTIASGGDFWESGGALSTAGSSTSIQLSVSPVTVNIGGETVTHGSQPVTHSATSGEFRSDVIYADSSGVDVQEGVEMVKLPEGNSFPSIWQPTPDNGSLVPGVPLWVVHITPEDAASADIESWQMQNRRMNAQTLQPAAVASLLADYDVGANGAVQTTVEDTEHVGNELSGRIKRNYFTVNVPSPGDTIPGTQADENYLEKRVTLPVNHRFRIWRTSLTSLDRLSLPNNIRLRVVRYTDSGVFESYVSAEPADYDADGFAPIHNSADTSGAAPNQQALGFRVENTSDTAESGDRFGGTFQCSMMDADRDPS